MAASSSSRPQYSQASSLVFCVDCLVWARLRGFPAWPSQVLSLPSDTSKPKARMEVIFLGTHDKSFVSVADAAPFDPADRETRDPRFIPPKKPSLRASFEAALAEAEELLKPPPPPPKVKSKAAKSKSKSAVDPQAQAELDRLSAYVEARGGTSDMLEGWNCIPSNRTGRKPGEPRVDVQYIEPDGNKHRSRKAVARALGLLDDDEEEEAEPQEEEAGPQPTSESAQLEPSEPVRRSSRPVVPLARFGVDDDDNEEEFSARSAKAAAPTALPAGSGSEGSLKRGGRVRSSLTMTRRSRSELPPLRNTEASAIDHYGFAEVPSMLSADLCKLIAAEPMDDGEGISNAFQKSLEGPLLAECEKALGASSAVADAIEAAFGVRRFAVRTIKILMTEFCAAPQIPHADDFCNRELFGIAHLLPNQPQTECLPYKHDANYPTGVAAECDACGRWLPLPDKIARRRAHLVSFTCRDANRCCIGEPPTSAPAPSLAAAASSVQLSPHSPTARRGRGGGDDDEGLVPSPSASTNVAEVGGGGGGMSPPPCKRIQPGDRVQGKYQGQIGGLNWFDGEVRAVHEDGTCDLHYDDGDFEERVGPRWIKVTATGAEQAAAKAERAAQQAAAAEACNPTVAKGTGKGTSKRPAAKSETSDEPNDDAALKRLRSQATVGSGGSSSSSPASEINQVTVGACSLV